MEIEPSVVETLLKSVLGQPGHLPLLQFAMERLWIEKMGQRITWETYEKIGRLEGAIAQHADTVCEQFIDSDNLAVVQTLFRHLVNVGDPGEGGADTRRRALRLELEGLSSQASAVLAQLIKGRLVIAHENEVEIAHEALTREWGRLRGWINEDREFLLWQQRLRVSSTEWLRSKRHQSALLAGPRLAEAEEWVRERSNDLSAGEREFVTTSQRARDQRAKKVRKLAIISAIAVLLAISIAIWQIQVRFKLGHKRAIRAADHALVLSLNNRANELWPVADQYRMEYIKWLQEAEALLLRLPQHQADLVAMNNLKSGDADPDSSLQKDFLNDLVQKLGQFSAVDGPLASIKWRLEYLQTVRQKSLDEFASEWADAVSRIRNSPRYRGLTIEPQVGLIPLGPDRVSGLEEFLCLQTQEGPAVRRNAESQIHLARSTGIVFVLIPGGSFLMGATADDKNQANYDRYAQPDESPIRQVDLEPFFISKYELTNAQWNRLPRNYTTTVRSSVADQSYDSAMMPVSRVTLTEVTRALSRLEMMLPTEAQWEYAARGGTNTVYWSGNDEADLIRAGWFSRNSGRQLHAVGQKAPNPFGLHDVLGNVWEWCLDWYRERGYDLVPRPGDGLRLGPDGMYRVIRGGCFRDSARYARVAGRHDSSPDDGFVSIGVRPVKLIMKRGG